MGQRAHNIGESLPIRAHLCSVQKRDRKRGGDDSVDVHFKDHCSPHLAPLCKGYTVVRTKTPVNERGSADSFANGMRLFFVLTQI